MNSRIEKNKKIVQTIKKEKHEKFFKVLLTIIMIMAIIILLFFLSCRFIGTSFIETHEYTIQDTSIPQSFHGIKILHISDLLFGSTIDEKDLEKLTREIELINPNLVVFTGDLIYNKYTINKEDMELLKKFLSNIPYTIGKYAVKGEMDTNTLDLILNNSNFTLLNNEVKTVYNSSLEGLDIIGLSGSNTTLTIDDTNYKISLIHNFDYYEQYNLNSNIVLAGHNLNGEINFPGLRYENNKYNNSYYNINNTKVYISNGLGSIHKLRFLNHPSLSVYRLYVK